MCLEAREVGGIVAVVLLDDILELSVVGVRGVAVGVDEMAAVDYLLVKLMVDSGCSSSFVDYFDAVNDVLDPSRLG